jgi:hypothetical protein
MGSAREASDLGLGGGALRWSVEQAKSRCDFIGLTVIPSHSDLVPITEGNNICEHLPDRGKKTETNIPEKNS